VNAAPELFENLSKLIEVNSSGKVKAVQ